MYVKTTTAKHYDSHAKQYEHQWQEYLNNTHNKMWDRLIPNLEERDSILDVSCGTGLLAGKLIVGSVPIQELVLSNNSSRMLEIAQSRLSNDRCICFMAFLA